MKKLTIIFSIFLILIFASAVSFVGFSKDFTKPTNKENLKVVKSDDKNSPVWNMTYDDLVKYFADNGLISLDKHNRLTDGVATKAQLYNGIEIYWWDVKNLVKGSAEYKAYYSLKNNGYIDLWGSGNIMWPERNGPFAIGLKGYKGDSTKVIKLFEKFGKNK
ncbi:hypothetical protein [Clostridium hydrogenum]|uniref:hypothetical protein n=1 Tax=Clostridium hydrogenum TaxID=2855764 RepID=UPI001F2198AE|nr:hypothetical protein [Clostridium hydrogenum]